MTSKNPNPKLFVTGPRSRVGSRLLESAARQGIALAGPDPTARSGRPCDITDPVRVRRFFEDEKPDWVIHTAAMTDVDGCESAREEAGKVNVEGSRNVARASREFGCRLIALSTDYVFDGKDGPYSESDPPAPVNVYGRTKLEGEAAVLEACPGALVARISVPYDWNPAARPNFVMWLAGRLEAREPVRVVADQWSTPTSVPRLAEDLLEYCRKDRAGVVHLAGADFISRYDFALRVCRKFGLDESLVRRASSEEFRQAAARPGRAGLKCREAEKDLGEKMTGTDAGLEAALKAKKSLR